MPRPLKVYEKSNLDELTLAILKGIAEKRNIATGQKDKKTLIADILQYQEAPAPAPKAPPEPAPKVSEDDYTIEYNKKNLVNLTMPELKSLASTLGIKGISKLTKVPLQQFIKNFIIKNNASIKGLKITSSLPDESSEDAASLPDESPQGTASLPDESPQGTASLPDESPQGTASLPEPPNVSLEEEEEGTALPDESPEGMASASLPEPPVESEVIEEVEDLPSDSDEDEGEIGHPTLSQLLCQRPNKTGDFKRCQEGLVCNLSHESGSPTCQEEEGDEGHVIDFDGQKFIGNADVMKSVEDELGRRPAIVPEEIEVSEMGDEDIPLEEKEEEEEEEETGRQSPLGVVSAERVLAKIKELNMGETDDNYVNDINKCLGLV